MKNRFKLLALFALGTFFLMAGKNPTDPAATPTVTSEAQERLLRHVVLFKFKEGTRAEKIEEIEEAFGDLQRKIPQIYRYEWGMNNSPENLNKGFTHCFFLSFKTEEDRAVYLPHPDHKAFGALLGPHLDDVLVVDYWTP